MYAPKLPVTASPANVTLLLMTSAAAQQNVPVQTAR